MATRPRTKTIAEAVLLLVLAGCADGGDGAGGAGPVEASRPQAESSREARAAVAGPDGGEQPAEPPAGKIAIRRGRISARVDVVTGAPQLVLGGATFQLTEDDGSFDRTSAEELFAVLEDAGDFLEIELIMPPQMPGKVLEQMVFFMEEKGKVPIVSWVEDERDR